MINKKIYVVDLILVEGKIIITSLHPGRYRGKWRCYNERGFLRL